MTDFLSHVLVPARCSDDAITAILASNPQMTAEQIVTLYAKITRVAGVIPPPASLAASVFFEPVDGKYGEVLRPFVSMMARELHANASKGDRPGWLSMSPDVAMLEIYYHVAKLQKAVRDGDTARIAEYSADVANMSMMVADIFCALLTPPTGGATT